MDCGEEGLGSKCVAHCGPSTPVQQNKRKVRAKAVESLYTMVRNTLWLLGLSAGEPHTPPEPLMQLRRTAQPARPLASRAIYNRARCQMVQADSNLARNLHQRTASRWLTRPAALTVPDLAWQVGSASEPHQGLSASNSKKMEETAMRTASIGR